MIRHCCTLLISIASGFCVASEPWTRHVIDDSARGADGVRLADFDGDGLQDVVTGWEQSGVVRLYLNPGAELAREKWPAVTVGKARSPEDAVPFDFDGDGLMDIVSCHEGKTRQVYVHRNLDGSNRNALLKESNWRSMPISRLDGELWMFAEPILLAAKRRGLVVGSKGKGSITLLIAPDGDAADPNHWAIKKLRDAGWIMTLKSLDMDGDGDDDVIFSDRKGNRRGVNWLQQPTNPGDEPWVEHTIGGESHEAMFMDATPGRVLVSTRNGLILDFARTNSGWQAGEIPNPPSVPFGKAIKRFDQTRFVFTANTAADKKTNPKQPGIWLGDSEHNWRVIDNTSAIKPDRIECLDLDGDGDLDVMTCEEVKNLGVIWYENPGLAAAR